MDKFTWKNIIAFTVYQCKLCGEIIDEGSRHMSEKHGIRSTVWFNGKGYSHYYEYPNVLATPTKEEE